MSKIYYYFMVTLAAVGIGFGCKTGKDLFCIMCAIIIVGAWISLEIKGDKDERS